MSNKTALATKTAASAETTALEIPMIAESKWDEARKFIDASGRFERCKLVAQAMAGMHLRDIQREMGLGHGGARRGSSCQNGNLKFTELVESKLGLTYRTSARLMEMGDQLRKRLKKLPELGGVEIERAAIGELSEPQVKALEAGVRRLTDDRTQQQLLAELGLYKAGQSAAPGGARDGGGSGGSAGRSPEQAAATAKDIATTDWTALDLMLRGYGDKFLVLPDADVTVQIAALEAHVIIRRSWLSKPRAQRDPAAITTRLNAMLTGKATTASES